MATSDSGMVILRQLDSGIQMVVAWNRHLDGGGRMAAAGQWWLESSVGRGWQHPDDRIVVSGQWHQGGSSKKASLYRLHWDRCIVKSLYWPSSALTAVQAWQHQNCSIRAHANMFPNYDTPFSFCMNDACDIFLIQIKNQIRFVFDLVKLTLFRSHYGSFVLLEFFSKRLLWGFFSFFLCVYAHLNIFVFYHLFTAFYSYTWIKVSY